MLEPQNEETSPPAQSLSFEEAFTRLGAMVETLESGGLPLAQASDLFEQGMTLVRRCSQLLDDTELKISQIRDNAGSSGAPADGLPWQDDLEMPPPDDDWGPEEDLPGTF
jgi:exodeoxyribonuclease VII small subunit